MSNTPMTRAFFALAMLGLSPGLCAQQPDEGTPAARFAAVKADHEKAMKAFVTAYQAAKSEAEKDALVRDQLPKPEPYVARMIAIAAESPNDPVAVDCLTWALDNGRDEEQMAAVLQTLQRDHLTSPKLGDVCMTLRGGGIKNDEAFLRAVLADNPHRPVRAQACYVLGLLHTQAATLARTVQSGGDPARVQQLAARYGEEWLAAMRTADAAQLQQQGEALLERVAAEFGEVAAPRGTLGEWATADLFELRHLTVGKPAPEIVGTDLDGVEFKLSDYRGKVIFLDFWGFW
ncbi:MAG: hypothetical protein H6838_19910 [Planctomycetes bacterium]|nr:hypothetical protein [Planctomycetota bacterium]